MVEGASGGNARSRHQSVLTGLAMVAAAGLVVAAFVLIPGRPPASPTSPAGRPSPDDTAPATPLETPGPSTVSGSEIALEEVAWYTLVPVMFGSFEAPDLDDPPLPDPYDLLTIGTLDGNMTVQLKLSASVTDEGLEGAWANGPFDGVVLVGDDDGARSRLFTVSALDGAEADLLQANDAVVVGAIEARSGDLYFVPIDRETGLDRGLWRVPSGGGSSEVIHDGPIRLAPQDFAVGWRMEWSADGKVLVTQACRTRECVTLVHDVESGASRVDDGLGELIGVTDAHYVTAHGMVSLATGDVQQFASDMSGYVVAGTPGDWHLVGEPSNERLPRAYAMIAAPLPGGELRTLVEVDPREPTDARLQVGADAGVELPAGWILRWPTQATRYMDIAVPPHVWYAGELINVVTDERLIVPATAWPESETACEPIAPASLPSGSPPGEAITTPGGPFRWATWGEGDDQVVQVVGDWVYASESDASATPVTVRGQPARVVPMGSATGPWAIAWEEDGCRYEVQLVPGTTEAEAIAYAERYAAPEPTSEDEQLIADLIAFARAPTPSTLASLPFADDGVWLGLGDQPLERRTIPDLADANAWTLEAVAFRGRVGPFSALDHLADANELDVVVGEHPHCAAPPIPPPPEVADLRRLSVQPASYDSCARWWTVDLFIGADGSIEAVTLDRWEP